MCEALGVNLDIDNFTGYFNHPANKEHRIQIMLDPCHMIKLIRNTFETQKVIYNLKNQKIKLRYIEKLHELQERENLRAGNKLRKRHMNFRKQIMKFNLAVQTLSASVADAIEFCDKDMNYSDFKGSAATVEFIRILDRDEFDHLISRNPYGKGIKAPLKQKNESHWRPFFNIPVDYIKGLKT
jgi:hypothetical protein